MRIFKTEAQEHLLTINQGLVNLEQGKAGETIHDIFRAAHTLKGSARMVGLEDIGTIAHKMEDLFKEIEAGGVQASPEVIDRLLEGADVISKILETEGESGINVEDLVSRLAALIKKTSGPAKKKAAAPPVIKIEESKPATPRETPGPGKSGPPEETPGAAGETPAAPTGPARAKADTLRVPAFRLDRLIDITGELLINRIKLDARYHVARAILESLNQYLSEFDGLVRDGGRAQARDRLQKLRDSYHDFISEFTEDVVELDLNVDEIQTGALQLRMIPASTLFDEFPRLVRDLAREMKKEIRLAIRGEDTELDKRLLEQLNGPLLHLIRNCCDHGIESPEARVAAGKPAAGLITLQAYHHGPAVVIEVVDDGAGMNAARIREVAVARGVIDETTARNLPDEEVYYLTLRPGFSTSAIITNVSGRGVGLDVVKTNVEALRGDLSISSTPGAGTRIELRVPLTVSIIEALLIFQGGEIYALPMTAVEEVARIKVSELVTERGREVIPVRGRLLTLVRLHDLLGLAPLPGFETTINSTDEMIQLVVLRFRNQRLALVVDRLLREQQILVKSLGRQLTRAPLCSGATILRRGEPALILNVFDIFREAEGAAASGIREEALARQTEHRLPRILVVDDSITTRTIEKNILERAGYEVVTVVSGEEALAEMELAETMFDLFVIDVDMPGINGFELTERLRQDSRAKARPVIILTSRSSDEDRRKGIAVGAQAYIVKGGFDQNVLLETVKSLIEV